MLAIDCEATGVDLHHGARPFLVTTCDDTGVQEWFEWDVDPLTRAVTVPPDDLAEIQAKIDVARSWGKFKGEIAQRHCLVLQNEKYDAAALTAIGIKDWPWAQTNDTLIAGHVLASNQPHNLTDMVLQYCGKDILPWEARLEKACQEARRLAKKQFPKWRLAKFGLPEMPSCPKSKNTSKKQRGIEDRDTAWKYDSWLPRALARELGYPEPAQECDHDWEPSPSWKCTKCRGHYWWVLCSEYANTDSGSTMNLWKAMEQELRRRDLWEIYREGIKVAREIWKMEKYGVTGSKAHLRRIKQEFQAMSERLGQDCYAVAKAYSYDLKLPKSGNNKSLTTFCFGDSGDPDDPAPPQRWLDLPVLASSDKTGAPSLDKNVMEEYSVTLQGKQLKFISGLRGKRKYDTSVGYLESYERFWLPVPSGRLAPSQYFRIHPSLNQTATDTLRFGSSNPNSQNISKQEEECEECQGDGCETCKGTGKKRRSVRYCFGPAPGREWYSCDYENIELRIPAYVSGERVMVELFEKPNDPPYFGSYHLMNASIIYPDLFWPLAEQKGAFKKKYAATWYQWCKNFDFAVQYGAIPSSGTADAAAHKRGAQQLVVDRLKEHTKLNKAQIDYANRYGYVETLPDKTVNPKRGYPLLCGRTEYGKISPTIPLSYFVSGTAMWCTRKAMIRCGSRLEEWTSEDPRGYYMTLQVHDELVFDFPKDSDPDHAKINALRRLMEMSGEDIGIPLKVSVTFNPDNWSEGVTVAA